MLAPEKVLVNMLISTAFPKFTSVDLSILSKLDKPACAIGVVRFLSRPNLFKPLTDESISFSNSENAPTPDFAIFAFKDSVADTI